MITEHEYRLAGTCAAKVQFARMGLPRNDVGSSFDEWLRAEAGKVRALARHIFPDAIRVASGDMATMCAQTHRLLASGRRVADAVFVTDEVCARADFAESDGGIVRIYSVVPKAFDLERHSHELEFATQSGRLRKEWRSHLETVALRHWVVQQNFPLHRVVPLVVVPVSGVQARVEGLHGYFQKSESGWVVTHPEAVAEAGHFFRTISVAREVSPLVMAVPAKVAALSSFLAAPAAPEISYRCKKCEFRVPGPESGFGRCWGHLATISPHMYDLAFVYYVADPNGQPVTDRLAKEGRVSLWDVPVDRISGQYAARQLMQIQGTAENREIILPELKAELNQVAYPLHFLDIETVRSLLPVHRGVKINGLTLCQFSVHHRDNPGTELRHTEWLNANRADPNRRFLSALRTAIGDAGTVLVWTRYEEQSFSELLLELLSSNEETEDTEWLKRLLGSNRILDLHALCFAHFFHPAMAGRTSIKAVLPALWGTESPVKRRPPYSEFPAEIDPYAVLKAAGTISDGCLAMDGYLTVQGPDPVAATSAADALRRYCWVDTLAMCFVFDWWKWRLGAEEIDVEVVSSD